MDKAVVYFIECKAFIKIGKCMRHNFGKYAEKRNGQKNNRISELQGGNPFCLKVLGYIECLSMSVAGTKEKSLHNQFKHLLHKNEWHHKSDELVEYIKSHTREY